MKMHGIEFFISDYVNVKRPVSTVHLVTMAFMEIWKMMEMSQ